MSALSRSKGARFERLVANALHEELGIKFRRKPEASQRAGHDDLEADDPAFPFAVECKHGAEWRGAWWEQAQGQAHARGAYPALVYRLNRRSIVVRVPLTAVAEAAGGEPIEGWCEVTMATFCAIAREIMAGRLV